MLKIYALFGEEDMSPFKLESAAAAEIVKRELGAVHDYRQFLRTDEQFDGLQPAPYFGSAEFWLKPERASELQDTAAAIAEASGALTDVLGRKPDLIEHGAEHNITGTHRGDSGYKCTFLFNRKPAMALADFHHHWLHTHGPIAGKTQDAQRYVQSHIDAPDRTFDGVTELFWPDYPTAVASMASEQMRGDQATDAQNFVDGGSLTLFLGAETL